MTCNWGELKEPELNKTTYSIFTRLRNTGRAISRLESDDSITTKKITFILSVSEYPDTRVYCRTSVCQFPDAELLATDMKTSPGTK